LFIFNQLKHSCNVIPTKKNIKLISAEIKYYIDARINLRPKVNFIKWHHVRIMLREFALLKCSVNGRY
jgi:hypothetical protein